MNVRQIQNHKSLCVVKIYEALSEMEPTLKTQHLSSQNEDMRAEEIPKTIFLHSPKRI